MMKLCAPNTKILQKENAKKPKFEPNEKIRVNTSFNGNNVRMKLTPQIKASKLMEGAGGNNSIA